MKNQQQNNAYRTVWISDIHLGSKDCKAEYLLDFLKQSKIDILYLVGDIVDMWAMSKRFLWPKSHNDLFYYLLNLSTSGTKVIYLPGNHDEPCQKYDGMTFGAVDVHREYVHTTADGKKLLIMHGDVFDNDVCLGPMIVWIGDKGYDFLLFLNRWYNKARAWLGFPYWSLSSYIKTKLSGANEAIALYRNACVKRAKESGMDGIVCGHIHHPEVIEMDGVTYFNDGDWIENCSALTEDAQGNIELITWTQLSQSDAQVHTISDFKSTPGSQKAA